ncbi:PTS system mannose/fructose/sorbose family transporter subunit IID [Anaerococcus sp. AGMB00486]|uniref:PTS system mannose/fructose/sorbose family transporter subunit IID n=2 Tax=Anaerococcus TaxID=165779 RepID=A0ABX2N913_9FIRM|nr:MULTISPECIES: PTS system mannose/fructose/sorbose family transporter subunit IID [Anaerococcus]MDY3005577.1 PTS system mannose/fructose/sorbose family transporter subunit IID [Anaerococcus porci]MSS77508.1 PTS system mannose/fructose/sorbose family transporter subunit IID [Anaerococcus porci]NVF11175.1 PTS system mannose/fructose/sorbose family transporter subunit IID [Anaerococcus faecalis]
MEYNDMNSYKDTNPSPKLDQKTLNKMVWRSLFLQASFNYERMQAGGWLYSILPGLEKIHTNKEDLSKSMTHNLEFFNTHPFLVTFVMGIILSLEQNKVEIPTIRAVRVAAMGPLGGIGDAIFWFTLVPIVAGISSNMALQGSIAGPILFFTVFNICQFALRFWLMNWSYKMGESAIDILTENAKEFTRAASILGVIVVGALVSVYGDTSIALEVDNGTTNTPVLVDTIVNNNEISQYDDLLYKDKEKKELNDGAVIRDLGNGKSEIEFNTYEEQPVKVKIQEVLDGIIPDLVPLSITLLLFFLLTKRKWTPIKCIGFLLVLGIVGAYIGVF